MPLLAPDGQDFARKGDPKGAGGGAAAYSANCRHRYTATTLAAATRFSTVTHSSAAWALPVTPAPNMTAGVRAHLGGFGAVKIERTLLGLRGLQNRQRKK